MTAASSCFAVFVMFYDLMRKLSRRRAAQCFMHLFTSAFGILALKYIKTVLQ